MKKVLFVIGATESGGAEKRAIFISKLLKGRFDTSVFAFHGKSVDGVDFVYKDEYKKYKEEKYSSKVKALKNYIDLYKPDIVFSFVPHINFFVTRALKNKRFSHIKHVVSIVAPFMSRLSKVLINYSIRRADAVYYQCEDQKKYVRCKCYNFSLFNPINSYPFINKPKHHFMSAGRLDDQKDYPLLIKSFYLIQKEIPDATLDIYGSGEDKSKLEELINELNLNKSITIIDYLSKLNEEFDKHDVFLFTSKFEGFPNALAEAMGHGLICFTTYFETGCNELIIEDKTGFVCRSRDEIDYSSLVISKLKNYDSALEKALFATEYIKEKCNLDNFVLELEKQINTMLSN